ncbi:Gfo/Idh/MocA family oxidoreductase [Micromonospora sp. NPDC050397]|uniref:Gfo/Idh/MocA family oxidoreductase n=1 Tax=Micromonospora sp. NPDC050397 TaxID=3364279 RepID=UPI00385181D1
MSASALRFGLVGYGFGGRYFHAPLIASAPGVELVGVVTTSESRRDELAREWPGTATYDSLAALAAAGVDAVAISTPAATHADLAREAIRLGLAVVVDKPFTLDSATAREIVELAERSGVPLSVYQNRRWDSDLLTVRRLVEEGALGPVTRFESRFERFAPVPGPPAGGGGTLLDFGSHLVDQAMTLFGPVARVYAEMRVRDDLDGRDDDFLVALQHVGGVRSQLWGSWVQGAPGPRFRVTGTTGSYLVDGVDGQEDALIAGRTPAGEGERWGVEREERWGRVQRGATSTTVATERGRWDTFYPAFAAAVRGDGPVPVDPWDAVASLRVLDAARISATEGRVVTLE